MEISSLHDQLLTLPLPVYETILLAEVTSREGEPFTISVGMNQKQATRLNELSRDKTDAALQDNTSDYERFGEGSYEDWYAKGRTIFTLIHGKTGDVAAIVWFGPKSLGRKSLKHLTSEERLSKEQDLESQNWHTIAYRCYPNFRGQGLMKAFVTFALETYIKSIPSVKLWAGINTDNAASDALALSLGFEPLKEASDLEGKWLVMVRK